MEDCDLCNESSLYLCINCKVSLCKKHKLKHEKLPREHTFEKIAVELNPEQILSLSLNLLSKIQVSNELSSLIIEETQQILGTIQQMCTKTLQSITSKAQHYTDLLHLSRKPFPSIHLPEIERQLKTTASSHLPRPNLTDISNFFSFYFLQESEILSDLNSKPLSSSKAHLSEAYNLFLEAHEGSVACPSISADNKYLASGSDDNTFRLWNLPQNRLEYVFRGHSAPVSALSITANGKYLVSGSVVI